VIVIADATEFRKKTKLNPKTLSIAVLYIDPPLTVFAQLASRG
jgi:hypothetical protein